MASRRTVALRDAAHRSTTTGRTNRMNGHWPISVRVLAAAVLSAGIACQPASEDAGAAGDIPEHIATVFQALPDQPPELEGNPLTPVKLELGRMLFFDPRLSRSWLISCNTCHNLALAGVDMVETSIGHGWQRGPRNAPTVLNAVFNVAQFWDGRAEDLREQAKGPVQASVEMSNEPGRVVETLRSIPEYVDKFREAFPEAEEPVTFDNMALAIEAFEATLLTPSPFDRYLRGETGALTDPERAGLDVFVTSGCAGCHGGINVGGAAYYPFGVRQRPGADVLPPGDKGRYSVTQSDADEYVFRSPTLRNVELTAPYFHSGAVWELDAAVALMSTAQLGTELADDQRDAIVTFLQALTGEQPQIEYPVLPPHTEVTPRPDVSVTSPAAAH
jgi:cytochrome c peroxidase